MIKIASKESIFRARKPNQKNERKQNFRQVFLEVFHLVYLLTSDNWKINETEWILCSQISMNLEPITRSTSTFSTTRFYERIDFS